MNRAERRRLEKLGKKAGPPEALLHDAAAHHRAGSLAEAESRYRAFLALTPGHAQATHLLGLVCHQLGRNREAADLIADAERRAPADPEIPFNLGNCLILDDRPAEAAEAFTRALALRPGRADALNNLGNALQRLNLLQDAAAAYQGALASEPGRLDALSNLAHAQQGLGRLAEAIDTYRQVLARDPHHATARHMIAAMSGETPDAAPEEFVRSLFDGYAGHFESHLTGALAYDPAHVVHVLIRAAGSETRFTRALDLGCGTGLAAPLLRPICSHLIGIDLSPAMIARADTRHLYDELTAVGIDAFLDQAGPPVDLFLAADVFVYVGALDGIFAKAAARAASGAWFAFSVEGDDGDGFSLRTTGRYAHSLPYLERIMGKAGWQIREREPISVRTEHGISIPGYAVAAQRA